MKPAAANGWAIEHRADGSWELVHVTGSAIAIDPGSQTGVYQLIFSPEAVRGLAQCIQDAASMDQVRGAVRANRGLRVPDPRPTTREDD